MKPRTPRAIDPSNYSEVFGLVWAPRWVVYARRHGSQWDAVGSSDKVAEARQLAAAYGGVVCKYGDRPPTERPQQNRH